MKNKILKFFNDHPVWIAVFLGMVIWLVVFKNFILGKYWIINDAVNYYEHFCYFFDNILRGVYPLWEPFRDAGTPTEFYMRRMGEFNPLYWLVLIPYKILGLPYLIAHLMFMSFYFLLGMAGFYRCAFEIFSDRKAAFVAFLLLLFSSMGTLIFCSFTILIFTPLIWFVFFVLKFLKTQERVFLLGMTFTLMILVQTYIPFYFFTVLLVLGFFSCLFYLKESLLNVRKIFKFVLSHKLFSLICLSLLLLALIPPMLFHQEVKSGDLVLTTRHYHSPDGYFLGVPAQRGDFGGVIPNLILDELVFNVKRIQFSQIYVSCFMYSLLAWALFVRVNRRLAVLFLSGFLLYSFSIYDAPIYKFFYDHVFYFKYFRNYQFFFWIGILPCIVLICAEQFRLMLAQLPEQKQDQWFYVFKVCLIHGLILILYLIRGDVVVSSLIVLVLSCGFFIFLKQILARGNFLFFFCVLALVCLEPIEVFHYLGKNASTQENRHRYFNGPEYLKLGLPTTESIKRFVPQDLSKSSTRLMDSFYRYYLATRWQISLETMFDQKLREGIYASPFEFYGNVEWLNQDPKQDLKINDALLNNKNIAFISLDGKQKPAINLQPSDVNALAGFALRDNPLVQLVKFDVNEVVVKTRFNQPKFLVYYDNFYPGWKVFVDGKEVELWRANIAYKGVFVPQGEAVVVFKYAPKGLLSLKIFLVAVFFITLVCLLWLLGRKLLKNV